MLYLHIKKLYISNNIIMNNMQNTSFFSKVEQPKAIWQNPFGKLHAAISGASYVLENKDIA